MAIMRDMSRAQYAFQLADGDIDQFLVVRFRGTEGLCQLYRFEIDLVCKDPQVDVSDIIGKSVVLSVHTRKGDRWFHGIISRFETTGETADQIYFRAEMVPAVWLLTHRYDSRIFQNKSLKTILNDVFTGAGLPSDRFDMERVVGFDDPIEYCVQYRETDFNFVCRLMEQAGIWWFFEQSKDKHVMVLSSKFADYQPIDDEPELPYHPPTGMNVEEEHVYRFRRSQSVRPGAVVLNDFNFEKPKVDLEAKADNERDPGLFFSDYPGEYREAADGLIIATVRAAEFEAGRTVATGQSNCRRLAPGRTFKLIEHPIDRLNDTYVITQILHQGKESTARSTAGTNGRSRFLDSRAHQSLLAARGSENTQIRELAEALLQIAARLGAGDPTANRSLTNWLYHAGQVVRDLPSAAMASGANPLEWLSIPNLLTDVAQYSIADFDSPTYDTRFECIPASVAFMPPRITPWPVIRGCQTARVVGPEGEEIHTDKFGRVKVQFHWDRVGLENGQPKKHGADSSCFIRVSQGMAGGQYGMMFIPRVGQEVVVDFIEGNPNNPIIVGRVFNADHMPPYPLPEEKTKSVIKTHSSKGGGGCNEIRFEDLKGKEQLLIQAQRQMDTMVKASHFHTAGAYHLLVGGEKDGELFGEYRQKVFKAKHTHVKGEERTWIEEKESRVIGKDQSIEVQGGRSLSVGGDMAEIISKNHKHEITSTYHCLADSIKLEASTAIELVVGGNTVVVCGDGIYIQGSMVYINSGAGPSVPAVSAGEGPLAAEDPGGAESTKPGKDTRYSAPSATPVAPGTPPEVPGHEFTATFIDIKMVDEEGRPVPGEPFEIILPSGELEHGITGADGLCHLEIPSDGTCQVSFNNLDAAVWEKIG